MTKRETSNARVIIYPFTALDNDLANTIEIKVLSAIDQKKRGMERAIVGGPNYQVWVYYHASNPLIHGPLA